jgi:hypothetical protein
MRFQMQEPSSAAFFAASALASAAVAPLPITMFALKVIALYVWIILSYPCLWPLDAADVSRISECIN